MSTSRVIAPLEFRVRPLAVSLTAAGMILVVVTALWSSMTALVSLVGLLVCALLGIVVAHHRQISRSAATLTVLETPFWLARDAVVFDQYRQLANSLLTISEQRDIIFRHVALEQVDELVRRAGVIAQGTFVFEGTETWRLAYEQLLRSPGLHRYRSVAWVQRPHYWQDEPGRKSLALNFVLVESQQVAIERIAIIEDALWPAADVWPVEPIRQWLDEQFVRGIHIQFVRSSRLAQESDLLADIGLYGSRALGIQQLDDQCQTVRFTLIFDVTAVLAAEIRWDRLAVYAESWAKYLDRYELPD
ncbi:MAG: hypothetical protein EXS05_19485 [Planctomycetaceae bacterium]|nr:hypothetical protein [Planctomycetaceae bacterium]